MKKELNEGGVNGFGMGVVNINSEEFKALHASIMKRAKSNQGNKF